MQFIKNPALQVRRPHPNLPVAGNNNLRRTRNQLKRRPGVAAVCGGEVMQNRPALRPRLARFQLNISRARRRQNIHGNRRLHRPRNISAFPRAPQSRANNPLKRPAIRTHKRILRRQVHPQRLTHNRQCEKSAPLRNRIRVNHHFPAVRRNQMVNSRPGKARNHPNRRPQLRKRNAFILPNLRRPRRPGGHPELKLPRHPRLRDNLKHRRISRVQFLRRRHRQSPRPADKRPKRLHIQQNPAQLRDIQSEPCLVHFHRPPLRVQPIGENRHRCLRPRLRINVGGIPAHRRQTNSGGNRRRRVILRQRTHAEAGGRRVVGRKLRRPVRQNLHARARRQPIRQPIKRRRNRRRQNARIGEQPRRVRIPQRRQRDLNPAGRNPRGIESGNRPNRRPRPVDQQPHRFRQRRQTPAAPERRTRLRPADGGLPQRQPAANNARIRNIRRHNQRQSPQQLRMRHINRNFISPDARTIRRVRRQNDSPLRIQFKGAVVVVVRNSGDGQRRPAFQRGRQNNRMRRKLDARQNNQRVLLRRRNRRKGRRQRQPQRPAVARIDANDIRGNVGGNLRSARLVRLRNLQPAVRVHIKVRAVHLHGRQFITIAHRKQRRLSVKPLRDEI